MLRLLTFLIAVAFLPQISFAQEYVAANEATPNQPNDFNQLLAKANMPVTASTQTPNNPVPNQIPQNVQSPAPSTNQNTDAATQFLNPQTDGKNSHTYSEAERDAWFKSCLGAVNDKKAAAFSDEFCQCGWAHISSGQLPADILSDTSPSSVDKRNQIMRVISQQCIVELLAKHNL